VAARPRPFPRLQALPAPAPLLRALGVARTALPVELYDNGLRHVYVALGTREEVAALRPDFGRLVALGNCGFNAFAGEGTRWKTRMFAPGHGVPEDPATGSPAGP